MSQQLEAVILAGGMARRMGGEDKGLVDLLGKPMVAHVIERLTPQVQQLRINANRSQAQYASFGYEVFADQQAGYLGPLSGMSSAMATSTAELILTVPCDCPLIPLDLAERMLHALTAQNADLAVATDGEREQPVVLLLKRSLLPSMLTFLDSGRRRIDMWYADLQVARVSFADQPNAFVNVNTPEEKQQLADAIAQS
ncbi:molybdopterin-guanine dinucleotide biosynthesis protein A [Shewanella mangrovi]|uniref:Molybdenum cofactor guanylyltransferase n=1 Tax=Shewanella mangrovi TaxID=1515746 RepID=A0A094JD37_9GAMM|nr:molybdenum cofactor guanylyltransferase MobA [Shewanella mangrovi]KFZ35954.1 molybdopterin-guanine dinucleotide biosynthesis protein A [Shewanella mangrovi]